MLFANTKTHFYLGTIQIVRDPRNVISSILYHFSKKNYNEAKNFLFDKNKALGKKFDLKDPNVNRNIFTVISSWNFTTILGNNLKKIIC